MRKLPFDGYAGEVEMINKRSIKKYVCSAGLLCLLFLSAGEALGCSCIVSEPEKNVKIDYRKWLINHDGAVFSGRVIKIDKDQAAYEKTVTFEVSEYWKGVSGPRVNIKTALDGAACGVHYEEGKKYFVIANGSKDSLRTDLCTWLGHKKSEAKYLKGLGKGNKPPSVFSTVPPLGIPHANNAVSDLKVNGKTYLFSFMGLTEGKTWRDTSKRAFMFVEGGNEWRRLPDLPVKEGRLAASAQSAGGKVYIFGGYTVAEDGSEKSTPEVFEFDPRTLKYARLADMPTPVDDMTTFAYQNRYIYLVSGWHDNGNVNLVQIYDTKTDKWTRGTDYPGTPVFGHAGGIVGNRFVIADGVAVIGKTEKGARIFDTVNEGWMGTIDSEDHTKITYRRLPQLPGKGHYRMAGAGDAVRNQVIFAGGTSTAYNYDGIGYDGTPAKASRHVFAWDFGKNNWTLLNQKPNATMDHRGMVKIDGKWFTIGGLDENREVAGDILPVLR